MKLRVCRLRIISQCFRALDLGLYLGGGVSAATCRALPWSLRIGIFGLGGYTTYIPKMNLASS